MIMYTHYPLEFVVLDPDGYYLRIRGEYYRRDKSSLRFEPLSEREIIDTISIIAQNITFQTWCFFKLTIE